MQLTQYFGHAAVVVAISLVSAACTDPVAQGTTDAAAEVSKPDSGEEDGLILPEIEQPPTITCKLAADPAVGNAPLPVKLAVTFEGTARENVFIRWDFGEGAPVTDYDLADPLQQDGDKVSHEFAFKGSYQVKASVIWRKKGGKYHGDCQTTINVKDPVALALTTIELVSAPTVGLGGDVSLTFAVINTGEEAAVPFEVNAYLSATQTFDDTAVLVHTQTVKSLSAGQTSESKISWVFTPENKDNKNNPYTFLVPKVGIADGDYFIHVAVDPKKTLNEINRTDNEGYATSLLKVDTKVAAKPDLVITAPTFNHLLSYSQGDSLPYEQEVANIGEGDAKSIKFAVFLSKDQQIDYDFELKEVCDEKGKNCADNPAQVDKMLTKLGTSNLLKLNSKSSLPLVYSVEIPDVPDGEYFLIAKIDVLDAVVETNEINNTAVSSLKVQVKKFVKLGVDLNLVAMTVKPKGTFLGGQVGLNWTVKNSGNQPLEQSSVGAIYFCPDKAFNKVQCVTNQKNFTIPPLAAGETKIGTELVTISILTPVKDYYIYLRLDPDNKVLELDEGNNVGLFDKLIITATQNVDLAVADIGFHPVTAAAGATFKMSYTVKNGGTTGAAAYTTWIALSPTMDCGPLLVNTGGNVVVKEVVSGGVDALSEGDVVEVVTLPLGLDHLIDKYYLCVMLDVKKANTKEQNPLNNNGVSATQLTVTGAKGGCFEDKLDDAPGNNSQPTAVALALNETHNLGSCGNDDWYKVNVPKGHSVFATLAATPLFATTPIPADLDLLIYAPDGKTVVDAQKLQSAVKKASALTVQTGGTWYLQIQPKSNGSKAQYTLQIQVVPPAAGTDLYAGALTINPNATFPGALIKTKLKLTNLGDKPAGPFAIRYALSKDAKLDATDPVLKDLIFAKGIAAAEAVDITQTFVLPLLPGGPYFVLAAADVSSAVAETNENNNAAVSNSLLLNTELSCQTDPYAGNHTANDAATLPPTGGLIQKLNVCPGLEDWFAISVPTGKALSVKMNWKYLAGKGLVGIQIVDSSQTGVIAGSATAVNSAATIPYVQAGGVFYIHTYVLPENGQAVPYDYELNVAVGEPEATDVCLADAYESNNSAASSLEIGCGLASLTLCLGDEDWFKITLKKDEAISFEFNHLGNSFQFKVFNNPALPALKTQAGNGNFTFNAPADGTYWMQASYKSAGSKPAQGFAYSLKVDGGKGVDLLAKIKSIFPAQVIQGEDVYLTVKLSNECQDPAGDFWYGYYFSTDNKLDPGDTLMSLRPMAGGLLGKTSKDVDDKTIVPTEAKPGPAYVIVAADATNSVLESQELNNTDAAAVEVIKLCIQDGFEPNGAPQIASPLLMGRTKDLSLCPYELDWYAIDLKKGETLTVTMEFTHNLGDLDMRLYKVNKFSAPVAVGASKTAPEQFSYTADESTKYFVRISGFAGESNAYQLIGCKALTGKCIECLNDTICNSSQQCDKLTTLCGPKDCTSAGLAPCNDGNLCTSDICPNGKCANVMTPGALCDDSEFCSVGESCDKTGACIAPTQTLVVGLPSSATTVIDIGTDVTRTSDGGYIVVGTRELQLGELRGYVARFDKLGQLKWEKIVADGSSPNLLQAVQVAGNEIVAVGSAGLTSKPGTTGAWYLRLSATDGSTIASKVLQIGTASAKLEGVQMVSKTEVVVVGSGYDPGATGLGLDGWLARLDYDGNPSWSNFVGGLGSDQLLDVALEPGGTLAVAVGNDDQSGSSRGMLIRFSTVDGGVVVEKAYAKDNSNTQFVCVQALVGGGVVVGGGSDLGQSTVKSYQALLARIDKANLVISMTIVPAVTPQAPAFSGIKTSRIEVVRAQADGSVVAGGWTGSTSEKAFVTDAAVWVFGSDDVVQNVWYYGLTGKDLLRGLVAFGEGWLGYGSLAELSETSDAFRLVILPPTPSCNDANPCTVDTCTPGAGCEHAAAADGTVCGAAKVCAAGKCPSK
ncbi:MAG: hypothetical protein EXR77_08600 [Myxococcales bacterium]|nr:hypothetical protein [Myxococcales bacterium]